MAQARKILIADPDVEAARNLARSLRERGYQLHAAPDGARALEISVLRHPDLVLFDETSQLLEARTFIQILRTNPRTEDIPVIVTGDGRDLERLRGYRDGYLRKPFNLDEVLSRIEQIFRRSEAARALKGEASEIEGSLKQMGIADLLQVLASNHRTGRVGLEHAGVKGEIFLLEGRPANARTGIVEGEKALFRLLSWNEGSFAFTPGPLGVPVRIDRGTEDALLEGMRQSDEAARLREKLPPRTVFLALAKNAQLPTELHPVTQQVVQALTESLSLGDLIDRCAASDFETMAAITSLLEKELVVVVERQKATDQVPLLQAAEVHALRAKLVKGRATSNVMGKLLVAGSPRTVARFAKALPRLPGYAMDKVGLVGDFGALGTLTLPDGLTMEILALPPAEDSRPLWRPFGAGAVVALVLDESGLPLANFFASDSRVHLLLAGAASVPGSLRRALGGASLGPPDPVEAIRQALSVAASPVARSV
jgi:CheY-like chemotaxis protein